MFWIMWLELASALVFSRLDKYGSADQDVRESATYEAIWDLLVEVIMKFLHQSKNQSIKLGVGQMGNIGLYLASGKPDD